MLLVTILWAAVCVVCDYRVCDYLVRAVCDYLVFVCACECVLA